MKIAVILTAFDKMSSVIDSATANAQEKLSKLMKKDFFEGGAMMATGAGIAASLAPAVRAYSNLEVANADLKASMMDATGAIDKNFENISKLAEGLGNQLPGTTADFYQLFQTMMNNGVKSQSILQGVGKAAAFLAVDLKMPYTAAGEFAARMKEATGVADSEMLRFMNTISRANSLGVQASEMQYAFSRSAGSLKLLNLQGLAASNSMTALYASLIRAGMSGETAASSFNNIVQNLLDKNKFAKFQEMARASGLGFQFFDKEGKFLGVENMVSQFDKMKGLSTTKRAELVQALTGGGGDAQALNAIISNGTAGYQKMRAEMERKATLNDKVNEKLKTLNSLWEATTGTIENMLAAIGAGFGPVLKPVVDMIGRVAGYLKEWFTQNPEMARFLTMFVALSSAAFTIAGVIRIITGLRVAFQLLNVTMMANPFILVATLAVTAGSLIYAYWDKIGPFFSRIWDRVKQIFATAWKWLKKLFWDYQPAVLIFTHWQSIAAFFTNVWEGVKAVFRGVVNWLTGLGSTFFNAGKNIVLSIYNGIKSVFSYPINKVKEMVGKIRNLLPFSPAKDGPLKDIHKIRLVETIAEAVKPGALVDKMRNVAKLSFDVMNVKPGKAAAPAIAARGQTVISPSFQIYLSGSATKEDANLVVREIEKRFPQLMRKYQSQQSRIALG